MLDPEKLETVVDKYVSENRTDDAVKALCDLVELYLQEKKFSKAEEMRDRLYDVDPSALMEIIKSSGLIDEEKSKAIDKDHLTIWSKLYSGLSDDDLNTLHFAMNELEYDSNEIIFSQGDEDANLYFIDHGQLKLTCIQGKIEQLIMDIGPGELAGADTFFSNASHCTHSLVTLSKVKLHVLPKDVVSLWEKDAHQVISRLKDYCSKFESFETRLKKHGVDRREHLRLELPGKGIVKFLDASGSPSGKAIKVGLADISSGGVSFFLRFSQPEAARLILGRNMYIKFPITVQNQTKELTKKGMVVGIRSHGFGDNSAHIKFDKLISEKVMTALSKE